MRRKVGTLDLDRWLLPLLILNLLVWVVARFISDTNLDPYGDMLENFAWGQEFSWGTHKHPPLIGWVTALWFSILPRNDTAYHLLSYLNVSLGLVGVYRVAIVLGFARVAVPTVLLLAMALPYSTLAVKFNANAILLSLWPWVVFGWLKSQQETDTNVNTWTILFGVLGGLALLGKYYSGVLMVGLLLASFSSKDGRHWLKSYKPWLSGIVFTLILTPHILWLFDNSFISFAYIAAQSENRAPYRALLKFAFVPWLYWLIPLLICAWIGTRQEQSVIARIRRFFKNLVLAWYCRGWNDTLFWMVMLPWLLTLLFGILGFVTLSLPWAIPLGFGFPLLWIRNLWQAEGDVMANYSGSILRIFCVWLALILIVSPIFAVFEAKRESANYYRPRAEAAEAIIQKWQEMLPDNELHWVGGQWAENGLVAFYGNPEIKILPGLPDSEAAAAVSSLDWRRKPGLILCPRRKAATPPPFSCPRDTTSWLEENSLPVRTIEVRVQKNGFRFPVEWEFEYLGYIYLPKEGRAVDDS